MRGFVYCVAIVNDIAKNTTFPAQSATFTRQYEQRERLVKTELARTVGAIWPQDLTEPEIRVLEKALILLHEVAES